MRWPVGMAAVKPGRGWEVAAGLPRPGAFVPPAPLVGLWREIRALRLFLDASSYDAVIGAWRVHEFGSAECVVAGFGTDVAHANPVARSGEVMAHQFHPEGRANRLLPYA